MPPRRKAKSQPLEMEHNEEISINETSENGDEGSDEEAKETAIEKAYKNRKWTKVFKISKGEVSQISLFSLLIDIQELEDLPSYTQKKRRAKWEMIFDPDIFLDANPDLQMDEWRLSEVQMKNMAVITS